MSTTRPVAPTSDNPFEALSPITDPSKGITRSEAMDAVVDSVLHDEYVSVLAPRQTGKTTFLDQCARLMSGEPRIYIDFLRKEYQNLDEVLCDLLEAVEKKLGGPAPALDAGRHDEDRLIDWLLRLDTPDRLIFLVDEVRALGSLALSFLKAVRSYHHEMLRRGAVARRHVFVIAGSTDLAAFTLGLDQKQSPFNFSRVHYLDDFDAAEVRDLIRRLAGDHFSDWAIGKIFEYTRGQPSLTQYLCRELHPLDSAAIDEKLRDLKSLIAELRVEDAPAVRIMVNYVLERTTDASSAHALLRSVMQGKQTNFSHNHPGVRDLWLHGALAESQGYCVIRNPIYRAILEDNLRIQDEIRRARSGGPPEPHLEPLQNFQGFLAVCIFAESQPVPYDPQERCFALESDRDYRLEITIATQELTETHGLRAPISVTEGVGPQADVELTVRPESFYDLGEMEEQTHAFPPEMPAVTHLYTFPIRTNSAAPNPVHVDVYVYQGVSLIHLSDVALRIG